MNLNFSCTEQLKWSVKCNENKIQDDRLTTNETVIAETEYGKVKGIKRLTVYDDSYYSFEGIPYAQPPLGELRFKAPQRPTPWDGVRDCCNYKDKSVQRDFISLKLCGSEDCLYLSVYTNNLTPETKRPVLVYIHGGGFVVGENSRDWYGPDYFIKKDVVLITIQYRLGVLGFLSLNNENLNIPGNAGLKDQVMALRWIKNNCSNFGGNPDNICVIGESAGAASTHYMMMTEQTRGLFHRAILMSGNAISQWAITQCQQHAITIAKLAGYKGEDNEKDILNFLMKAKAYDLTNVEDKVLTHEELKNKVMIPFGPTVEPYETADCVINRNVREMAKTAWGNSIPTMTGCTSYEGLLFLSFDKQMAAVVQQELETCVNFVPIELADVERTAPETLEKAEKIKKAHVTGETPTTDNLLDLCSHFYFWFPLHRLIQLRFNHTSSAPVYIYRFDFDSEEIIYPSRIMRHSRGVKGVSHADELAYLFWTAVGKRLPKESKEMKTVERMINIWTQFANTGNPCSGEIEGMENIVWDPIKKSDEVYKCLNISDELKVIDLPEMKKMKIWESMFEKQRDLF